MYTDMNSALTKITIANYRSIYRPQTIDFNKTYKKVIALYGKNASGKSNIIRAIKTMSNIVIHSGDAGYTLPYDPFHYSVNFDNLLPTVFSIEARDDRHVMEYSFAYNNTFITRETLKIKSEKTNKYKVLFARTENEIANAAAANYGFGQRMIERTLPKTLLLTKAYEDNNPFAKFIFDAISHIEFAPMNSKSLEIRIANILAEDNDIRQEVVEQITKYDPGILDIRTYSTHTLNGLLNNESDDAGLLRKLMRLNITNIEVVRQYNNVIYSEDIDNESTGTKAILITLVMLLHAIKYDKMLCMDEFGNFIHPYVVAEISKFYESQKPNKSFFVSTHQLGLYDYIDRTERIIIKKDPILGETIIDQRKASISSRKAKEDRREANSYYNTNGTYEKEQFFDETKLYDETGLL